VDRIDQLEKYEGKAFRIYNAIANIAFLKTKVIYRKELSKNLELKDIGSDSCIVCGNGPSINLFDFNKIPNMPVFTVNKFHKGNIELGNRLKFHVFIDDSFYRPPLLDEIVKIYNNNEDTKFIFKLSEIEVFKDKVKKLNRAYFVNAKLVQYGNFIALDMRKNTVACSNVIHSCIQSAIYMGYKKIYLIGCESDFFTNYSYFYESNSDNKRNIVKWGNTFRWIHMAMKHYEALERYAKSKRIEIINITPNSYLDAFDRMDLESFYRQYESK